MSFTKPYQVWSIFIMHLGPSVLSVTLIPNCTMLCKEKEGGVKLSNSNFFKFNQNPTA